MSDANFPLTADSDFDDLPRTLRREKEARAREARERGRAMDASMGSAPPYLGHGHTRPAPAMYGDEPVAAAVQRFNVPFFHLVGFFLKCALAAIPAMILLGAFLYFAGKGLEAYYPDLIRMKIMISFPTG
jgi:hypothetical protein